MILQPNTIATPHLPFDPSVLKKAPGGGPTLDSFLQSTDNERIGKDAPYPSDMDGHRALSIHQELRQMAVEAKVCPRNP